MRTPRVRVLTLSFSFSLFCSVEKPSHAHRDQLFHSESLLRWRAGHHHLLACQSGGGHHRDLVLWEHTLQNCAIFTGMWLFWHTVLGPIWCRLTRPCFHTCYISLSQHQRDENTYYSFWSHLMSCALCEVCHPCAIIRFYQLGFYQTTSLGSNIQSKKMS